MKITPALANKSGLNSIKLFFAAGHGALASGLLYALLLIPFMEQEEMKQQSAVFYSAVSAYALLFQLVVCHLESRWVAKTKRNDPTWTPNISTLRVGEEESLLPGQETPAKDHGGYHHCAAGFRNNISYAERCNILSRGIPWGSSKGQYFRGSLRYTLIFSIALAAGNSVANLFKQQLTYSASLALYAGVGIFFAGVIEGTQSYRMPGLGRL